MPPDSTNLIVLLTYSLFLTSDFGSRLCVNHVLVIENVEIPGMTDSCS